ncbi:hypothetical protein JCM16418A_15650 [Paenibacillus pini]|uniref:Uncharacterized protein n=1 Tax=Paenibacillus pini JCM 16418 TaxID=1236976 RepID=W7Z8T6_9BACL|nr:hypothetical protein JCM16418_5104 [Paenibacillus pini JCM 16418]
MIELYKVLSHGIYDHDGNELNIEDTVKIYESQGLKVTRERKLETIYYMNDDGDVYTTEENCEVVKFV